MMAGGGGMVGALDGGPPCRLSILRNANVACLCRLFMPMSHVEFKKFPCHMSLYCLKPCRMSIGSMSHVEFKKWPCHPVEFKGQGPLEPLACKFQFLFNECMLNRNLFRGTCT